MDRNIQFIQTSPEQLVKLISEGILSQLEDFKKGISPINEDVLMTREETWEFLHIHESTLWDWTKKGKIKAYGIANRIYYKKADILESLKPFKIAS